MSWLPAAVLFGSSVFPLGYVFSGENRDFVGKTGAVSVLIPIAGLLLGIALAVGSLDSLLSSPIRLGVTALGIVEVLVVVGFLTPRVIGRTAGEQAVDAVEKRAGSSEHSNDGPSAATPSTESPPADESGDSDIDAASDTTTEQSVASTDASGSSWRYVLLGLLFVFVLNPAAVAVLGTPIAGLVLLGVGTVVGLFGLYRVVF